MLWVCVGLVLLGLWFMPRAQDAAAQSDDEPPQKVIRVETNADGTINLNDVLSGKPPAAADAKSPWSPDGVEDFSFENCDGRTITKQDLLGRPWVAAFVFTHCVSTCPMITGRLRSLQDAFPNDDVRFVSFTVDPKRDTKDVLQKYAELNGADLDKWYFLRGEAVDVYGLIHRNFQMPVQMPSELDGNYQVIHSNNLMLVDANGVVRGKFDGAKDEAVAALRRELRRMLHPQEPSAEGPPPAATLNPAPAAEIPANAWYMALPAVNAGLNGLATVLLAAGYVLIQQKRVIAHRNVMLTAFGVSIVFLVCYLVYHAALHHDTGLAGKKFAGTGPVRPVYFSILISHVVLAAAVPVLAIITIYRGLKSDWARHRRIAKITYPIWMYVSVTGVIIYGMLYHWPI